MKLILAKPKENFDARTDDLKDTATAFISRQHGTHKDPSMCQWQTGV